MKKKKETHTIGVRVRKLIWGLVCKEAKENNRYPSDIVRESLDQRYGEKE